MPFDFEQELFLLAQAKANRRLGCVTSSGEPYPVERKHQDRADNLRDCYLDFYKEAERLRVKCQVPQV